MSAKVAPVESYNITFLVLHQQIGKHKSAFLSLGTNFLESSLDLRFQLVFVFSHQVKFQDNGRNKCIPKKMLSIKFDCCLHFFVLIVFLFFFNIKS